MTSSNIPPVVVVGAGLSGLLAALLLEAHDQSVLLIDGRDRLGGRIHGQSSANGRHTFDLGPAWVWPELNPRLAHWLAHLELPLFEQYTEGASLLELADRHLRRYDVSLKQHPASMRLKGGTSTLVSALQSRLQRTTVLLGTQLLALRSTSEGLLLQLSRAGQTSQLSASSMISALAPRQLASQVSWNPALPPHLLAHWQRAPTWMAGQAKFLATYGRPFWRQDGLSGAAGSQAGPMVEIHDASDSSGDQAALFGFVGLPYRARHEVGEAALRESCVRQLTRLFGPQASEPTGVWLHDWAGDPLIATTADVLSAAQHPDVLPTLLPTPWRDRIHLAGSEFAPDFPGYLEGAVQAAERAVEEWRNNS